LCWAKSNQSSKSQYAVLAGCSDSSAKSLHSFVFNCPRSSISGRLVIYIYMRIQETTSHERALLSGGKPPFSGLLCSAGTALTRAHTILPYSAGTALTRAHTIRRFCGAKGKEPRATRRGGPRCDWPNRYANQGRHLRSRKGHPRGGLVARSPLLGAPGHGARARSRAAHLASANSRIHLAAKRTMWPLVARRWRLCSSVASKRRPSAKVSGKLA